MITAVSLNPSIDRNLTVPSFQFGTMNRVAGSRRDAGGKAINVAVVAATMGLKTRCAGFLRKENGRFIENRLLLSGVECETIWLDGNVRTNLKVLDQSRGVVTEINEPGEPVTAQALDEMTELVARMAVDSDYLVLTGSLPPGCPKDYYAQLIEAARGLDCRCVLDAEGETLRHGIEARPFLIKPNRLELEMEVGRALSGVADVARSARAFIDKGVSRVAVSLGPDGALLADEREVCYAPGLPVEVKSTVGAGDSMVAGMIAALMRELPTEDVLRYGVASATASVMAEGTRLMDRATFQGLLGKIPVERV